jgi:hypothetical protein
MIGGEAAERRMDAVPTGSGMTKIVCIGLLLACSGALAQDAAHPKPVNMPGPVKRDIARMIKASGFDCPEIRTAYYAGSDDGGNTMRVMCGHIGGAVIESPTFRIHIGHYGGTRISRWEN